MKNNIHVFEEFGLGKAPFRFIGHVNTAANVDQDGMVLIDSRGGVETRTKPGGSCDFCGTYIVNFYWILSSDNKKFKVGSSCVEKTYDKGLIDAVKKEKNKIAREKRETKREAKRAEQKAARIKRVQAEQADRAKEEAKRAKELAQKQAKMEFIGTVGEMLDIEVKYLFSPYFEGYYGITYIHKFEDKNRNLIVWKTGNKMVHVGKGDTVKIRGRIKDHSEYRGDLQTVLTRCKVKQTS